MAICERFVREKIGAYRDQVDFLLALNQETIDRHGWRLKENSIVIYDSDGLMEEWGSV